MLGAGLDEKGVTFGHRKDLTLDFERAASFEDDVDLVVGVRLLRVRVRRYEHVDADLEPAGAMDDFVAAAARLESALRLADRERVGYEPSSVGKPASAHALRPPSITFTFS
jgi:hypothetical protein